MHTVPPTMAQYFRPVPFATDRNCDLVGDEIARLAALTEGADPATPVPSCPGWTLADLVDHVGTVHRWAATMVSVLSPKRMRSADMDLGRPSDPAAYPAWLAAGAEPVLATFRAADPDAAMWAWGRDQHARFWPRRIVHETAVHRADAELALGVESGIAADVAADGVDELLDNLPCAAYFAPRVAELRGDGESLGLVAGDEAAWRVDLRPDGFAWARTAAAQARRATVAAEADPADLLLLLYGRRPRSDRRITVTGDDAVLARWLECSTL